MGFGLSLFLVGAMGLISAVALVHCALHPDGSLARHIPEAFRESIKIYTPVPLFVMSLILMVGGVIQILQ